MPAGKLNSAVVPVPSLLPFTPANPATVVTTQLAPDGETSRKVWLPESATYRFPEASTPMPEGEAKSAPLFVPSVLPQIPPHPASVVTTPAGVTLRMMLLL